MGKISKSFHKLWIGPHKSFVKYAVCLTAGALIYLCFLGEDNVVRWVRAGIELRQQGRQMERYRKEIHDMDEQIGRLSTDRDTLEEFARERFHFAAPGEDVYLLKK